MANERLEIPVLDHSATLGEPTEIPLILHKPGLSFLRGDQVQYHGEIHVHDPIKGSSQTLKIQFHQDGSAYVTIVPLRLGEEVLTLAARYPDNGLVYRQVTLNVGPTAKKPSMLRVTAGIPEQNATHVVMALKGREREPQRFLGVFVKYDDIEPFISIDPTFATFKVTSQDQTDPIELDYQTGRVTAVHPGQALIETEFGGRRNLTCVDVEETMTPGRSYFEKRCQQLLSPGEKLGPQE